MSAATRKSSADRTAAYLAQTGRREMTARQRKRAAKKGRRADQTKAAK